MAAVLVYRMLRVRMLALLVAVMTAAVACNQALQGRLPVYSVKGRVLYKGSPLAAALVVFERAETVPPRSSRDSAPAAGTGPVRATGRTGPDGYFELMTYQGNDGAPAGEYRVGISSTPPHSESGIFSNSPGTVLKGNPDVLRGRYADPRSSGLRATVNEQDNELPPFQLP